MWKLWPFAASALDQKQPAKLPVQVPTRPGKKLQSRPSDIEESFFIAQTGEPLPQIQQVRQKSSGVVLMTMDQALPWVQGQQTISTDELAMIVIGGHEKLQTSHSKVNSSMSDAETQKKGQLSSTLQCFNWERRPIAFMFPSNQ